MFADTLRRPDSTLCQQNRLSIDQQAISPVDGSSDVQSAQVNSPLRQESLTAFSGRITLHLNNGCFRHPFRHCYGNYKSSQPSILFEFPVHSQAVRIRTSLISCRPRLMPLETTFRPQLRYPGGLAMAKIGNPSVSD
jgi:hypothetical protein